MAATLQRTPRRHDIDDAPDVTATEAESSDYVLNPRMQRVKRRRLEDPALETLVADGSFGAPAPVRPMR